MVRLSLAHPGQLSATPFVHAALLTSSLASSGDSIYFGAARLDLEGLSSSPPYELTIYRIDPATMTFTGSRALARVRPHPLRHREGARRPHGFLSPRRRPVDACAVGAGDLRALCRPARRRRRRRRRLCRQLVHAGRPVAGRRGEDRAGERPQWKGRLRDVPSGRIGPRVARRRRRKALGIRRRWHRHESARLRAALPGAHRQRCSRKSRSSTSDAGEHRARPRDRQRDLGMGLEHPRVQLVDHRQSACCYRPDRGGAGLRFAESSRAQASSTPSVRPASAASSLRPPAGSELALQRPAARQRPAAGPDSPAPPKRPSS